MFLFSLTCLAMAKAYCSISKDTLCDDLDSPHFFARLLDGGLYPCAITFVSTSYNKLKFNISLMIQVEKSIDHYRFIHLFVAEQIGSTLAMTLVIPLCIGIHQIVAFLSNMHGSFFPKKHTLDILSRDLELHNSFVGLHLLKTFVVGPTSNL